MRKSDREILSELLTNEVLQTIAEEYNLKIIEEDDIVYNKKAQKVANMIYDIIYQFLGKKSV